MRSRFVKGMMLGTGTLVAVAGLVSCGGDSDDTTLAGGTVFENVTVVDTRTGSLSSGQTVHVVEGRIRHVGPTADVQVAASATRVDGTGRYLVPGYNDMHTHAMGASDSTPSYWPLMIANGITGIREMGGSAALVAKAAALNADRAAGRVVAPAVLSIPGDLVAGVATAASGVELVRAQKSYGAQFIKVVAASPDATMAILGEARTQGLPVAGHVVPAIPSVALADAGWTSVEHLGGGLGLPLDCSTNTALRMQFAINGVRPAPVPTFVVSPFLYTAGNATYYQAAHDSFDEAGCRLTLKATVDRGMWQVPTLQRLRTMQMSDDAEFRSDPDLKYVDKALRTLWEDLAVQYTRDVPAPAAATFRQYHDLQKRLIPLLKEAGAKMMTGSDVGGIWLVPGHSLQREFKALADAGLTPLDVLRMTTLLPAEYLQRQSTMGTVEVGRNADLVLLAANPLADVAHLGRIEGVMSAGRYFNRTELDRMLTDVADAHAARPASPLSQVLDLDHRH